MTPAELADGLDLLDRVTSGNAIEDERIIARDVLREIRGLLKDVRSGANDVLVGRQVPLIRPSVALMKLDVMQPRDPNGRGALEGIQCWLEAQAGTRGRRVLAPVSFVTDNGEWTQLVLPREPMVFRRRA